MRMRARVIIGTEVRVACSDLAYRVPLPLEQSIT